MPSTVPITGRPVSQAAKSSKKVQFSFSELQGMREMIMMAKVTQNTTTTRDCSFVMVRSSSSATGNSFRSCSRR